MKSGIATVYLPQVSPGTHLVTTMKGRINSWVSCVPIAHARNQTGSAESWPGTLTSTPQKHQPEAKFSESSYAIFIQDEE